MYINIEKKGNFKGIYYNLFQIVWRREIFH
jgi:hypothetical protein